MQNACKRRQADARTRTGDPFITSEVLYQLSYVGAVAMLAPAAGGSAKSGGRRAGAAQAWSSRSIQRQMTSTA
jgi:hypothetical protein